MKVLTKNVFYAFNEGDKVKRELPRLWHTCENYKGGKNGVFRTELFKDEKNETDDSAVFACPHCNFTYTLDKFLNLA